MAQSFLIGPQPVPVRGREVAISPESPRLAQISKATGHLEEMMGHLLRSTVTQESSNQAADAYVYYKNKFADLDDEVAKIPDFDKRTDAFNKGMESIKGDLRKEYPTLSPTVLKGIELEMIGDKRETNLKITAERREEAERTAKRKLEDLNKLAVRSTSDAERASISNEAHKIIQSMADNRFIHPDEVAEQDKLFNYGVEKERLVAMAITNPRGLLALTPDQVKVSPSDLQTVQHQAIERVNLEDAEANATFKHLRNKARTDIANNPDLANNPAVAAAAGKDYTAPFLRYMTDEEKEAVAHQLKSYGTDVKGLNDYWETVLDGKEGQMTGTEIKYLGEIHSRFAANAKSAFHQYIMLKEKLLEQELTKRHTWPTGMGVSDPDKEWLDSHKETFKEMPDMGFNSRAEVDKFFNDQYKEIQDKYPSDAEKAATKPKKSPFTPHPEVPLPAGAIPIPTPATPTATETPTPTPEPTPVISEETPEPTVRTTPLEEPVPIGTPTP